MADSTTTTVSMWAEWLAAIGGAMGIAGVALMVHDHKQAKGHAVPGHNPTHSEVTDSQIYKLMQEAGQAGDDKAVRIARSALEGNAKARSVCETMIKDAEASAMLPAHHGA